MRAAALSIAVSMWVLVGCPYHGREIDDGAPIDSPGGVIADAGADASGVIGWAIHSRADFEDPGANIATPAIFTGVVASERDLIEPVAYAVGGLLGRGANTRLFNDAGAAWSIVDGAADTGHLTIDSPVADLGNGFPTGIGIDQEDTYTAWWEGEVFLEAGNHNLSVQADDYGFVEIDLPLGTVRAQDDSVLGGLPVVLVVPADGYYPIRVALAESGGTSQLIIFHQAPGQVGFGTLTRSRLRVRASEVAGMLRSGFDAKQLGSPGGATVIPSALIDEDYGGAFPADVGITDHDSWSQRLAGQAWLDATAMAALHVASDAGYRIVVDGVLISDPADLDDGSHDDTLAVPGTPARGWHDLAIDHQDDTGNTNLLVELAAPSPTPGLIPGTDLRTVSTGRERIGSARAAPGMVPIDGTKSLSMETGRLTDLVELSVRYQIDHPAWQELRVSLTTPWGVKVMIRDGVAESGNGNQGVTQLVPASDLPPGPAGTRPATGSWTLTVEDTTGAVAGTLIDFTLTARYVGGPPSIATTSQYVSGVHDFGTPRAISGLATTASTPDGSEATIALRTCDALPCTGPFMSVMTFPLPAARYAQIEVDATSNGVETWFVDDIDVYVEP